MACAGCIRSVVSVRVSVHSVETRHPESHIFEVLSRMQPMFLRAVNQEDDPDSLARSTHALLHGCRPLGIYKQN